MRIRLTAACLLGTLLLPSCRVMQQHVDFSWFSDVMSTPENDVVDVEAGTGLPETAVTASTATAQASSTSVLPAPPEPAEAPATAAPAPAVAALPAPVAAPAATPSGQTYTVAKGDTLNGIASRCKCTPQALAAANGITDPNKLKVGQILNLPGNTAQPAAAPQPVAANHTTTSKSEGTKKSSWKFWRQNATAAQPLYYTVQQGDTMSTIARRHGVTLQSLLTANGMTLQQANALRIGQRIALPATATTH